MFELSASTTASWVDGELRGPDRGLRGVGIDTRALAADALFVALPGSRVDGHDYVAAAAAAGAGAALLSRWQDVELPQIKVADPARALGRLAARWRREFAGPLLAITGSNGKTTVKEMLAAIMAGAGATLATRGNFNNELGVPLTLLRLGREHRYAVIEMGANHAGEIAYLSALARPAVAVLTNAAEAHLEGFGSLQGVVEAKGEIIDGLGADGVAILNADDPHCEQWVRRAGARSVLRFGFSATADVRGTIAADGSCSILADGGSWPFAPVLPGRHNFANALAAFAAARAVGLAPATILAGLQSMQAVQGRMASRPGLRGCRLVDDSYNANPGSLRAALDWLASLEGEAWLVLGDMAELGEDSAQIHAGMGQQAAAAGIDRLYTLGPQSVAAAKAYGPAAVPCSDAESLIEQLRADVRAQVTVLIKGSRRMGMERVVQALQANPLEDVG